MIDLDDFTELHQFDRSHLFTRAAQVDQRWAAAQTSLAALTASSDLAKLSQTTMPTAIVLALPAELHGIGLALCTLFRQSPTAGLWLWDPQQRFPSTNGPTILLSAVPSLSWPASTPTAQRTSLLDLTSFISADHHPAQVFLCLLGLVEQLWQSNEPLLPLHPAPPAELAACKPDVPVAHNPAKQIALQLYERLPCFWGVDALVGVAADWQMRLLWYAETMAWSASLAELAHLHVMARLPRYWFNIVTFVQLAEPATAQASPALIPQLAHLFALRRLPNVTITAPAELSPAERVWYLLEWGEWLALYTAALYNVDPTDRVPLQFLDDVR